MTITPRSPNNKLSSVAYAAIQHLGLVVHRLVRSTVAFRRLLPNAREFYPHRVVRVGTGGFCVTGRLERGEFERGVPTLKPSSYKNRGFFGDIGDRVAYSRMRVSSIHTGLSGSGHATIALSPSFSHG